MAVFARARLICKARGGSRDRSGEDSTVVVDVDLFKSVVEVEDEGDFVEIGSIALSEWADRLGLESLGSKGLELSGVGQLRALQRDLLDGDGEVLRGLENRGDRRGGTNSVNPTVRAVSEALSQFR